MDHLIPTTQRSTNRTTPTTTTKKRCTVPPKKPTRHAKSQTYATKQQPTRTNTTTKYKQQNNRKTLPIIEQHPAVKTAALSLPKRHRTLHSTQPTSQKPTNKTQHAHKVIPATVPVKEDIGKYGLMWPRGLAASHPAAKMLEEFSTAGCPVDTGTNWTEEQIIAAIKRGPHISAKEPEAAAYLHKETEEKLQGGYLTKVKWGDIKGSHPPNLKISPVAMIPHKSRSYRCILDLSFQLKVNKKKISSVNLGTVIKAPQKSMAHLGMVVKRLIFLLANNYDVQKPFFFSKCDIKDGFWRMVVSLIDAWNFAYVLPPTAATTSIDNMEIVIPHALQMGWAESPPLFCTAKETGRDTIQRFYNNFHSLPSHPLEHHLLQETLQMAPQLSPPSTATSIEVYVDDFITCTNNLAQDHLKHLARSMLHGIHCIFPPPSVTGHSGEDPIAMKKLLQLEGMFQPIKEVLGWEFNGLDFTITLPQKKRDKIISRLEMILQHRTSLHKPLEKLQGNLVHAALGLPAGKGLLSPLYAAVAKKKQSTKISGDLKQCLKDWKYLIKQIGARPTSVLELVPRTPHYVGYVDASKSAAGGVWVSGELPLQNYIVWRLEWPKDIQDAVVSNNNKKGHISINDLEMAGTLLAWLVFEKTCPTPLKYCHTGLFCDNNSTVHWIHKSSTTTSKIAGHLLRALALRRHIHQTAPMQVIHIAGEDNRMADVASCSFKDSKFTMSHKPFIDVFSSIFPLQTSCWIEYTLPKRTISKVTSCLRGKPFTMAWWTTTTKPDRNTGNTGNTTPAASRWTHTYQHAQKSNKLSSSQHSLRGSGQATTAKEILSEFHPLQKLWQPSPRPSNWLENHPLSTNQKKHTKHQWHGSLRATEEKTRHQHHNLPSQYVCQKNAKMQETGPTTPSNKL